MAAGLPGTGIGGLFYLLLGALMPLRGAVRALRGKSATPIRPTLVTLALLVGILATMWAQAWALSELVRALRPAGELQAIVALSGPTPGTYMKWAGLAGLLGLAFVFLAVHVLRIVVRRGAPTALHAQTQAPALPHPRRDGFSTALASRGGLGLRRRPSSARGGSRA